MEEGIQPPVSPPPVKSPIPLTEGTIHPTYQIYMGQHRTPENPWLSVFADDPLDHIWGSVVVLRTDPDGTETWSGQRFQYTETSGRLCPTDYMV